MSDQDVALLGRSLSLGYGGTTICSGLDLRIAKGDFAIIIGPNGCGKSTLLKALGRVLKPKAGEVLLSGQNIHQLPTQAVAKQLGILSQHPEAPPGMTVLELLAQGRYPQRSLFAGWTRADQAALDDALLATGITDLGNRPLAELSGGQRQRAWLAMVLAQQTEIILLDEPTTYLDVHHQFEILELLAKLNRDSGTTIVAVMHDLHQAMVFARSLIVMQHGRIVAQGAPDEVIGPEILFDVFGIDGEMLHHVDGSIRGFVPLRPARLPETANGDAN
ncbi:MAG: ABC transporter ATP-binding protein [Pseudomonadota bacterium]